ncbi:hypothetical protein QL285_031907 [Trifolium repens]|nr:hypothetical protein QL285_031907 [Trifolium repens]
MIISNASLSGNLTALTAGHGMNDFCILKAFKVRNHLPKALVITEIFWQPPPLRWVKCNSEGASKGNHGLPACGGIFRDYHANDLGCFASNLGVMDAFSAEIMGAINAIENTQRKGWNHLWLECDYKLVTLAFKSQLTIPWKLKNC